MSLKKIIELAADWQLISDVDELLISNNQANRENIKNFIKKNAHKIHHCRNLHGKVIITNSRFLLGSANFTQNGLTKKNEMSIIVDDKENVAELNIWFDEWWNKTTSPEIEAVNELLRSLFDREIHLTGVKKIPTDTPNISTNLFGIEKTTNISVSNIESKTNFWWFGINNKKNRKGGGHVIIDDIKSFLFGEQKYFFWKFGGARYSYKYYKQLKVGDKIIFWLGDGNFETNWGVIGCSTIVEIIEREQKHDNKYKLILDNFFQPSIKPYINGKPEETTVTKTLKDIFSVEFKPLGDIFRNLGYIKKRSTPITIEKISNDQYIKVINYQKAQYKQNVEKQ